MNGTVMARIRVGKRYQAEIPDCIPVHGRPESSWPAGGVLVSTYARYGDALVAAWTVALWCVVSGPVMQAMS